MFPETNKCYIAGHEARTSGAGRHACPHGLGDMYHRSLWLAGWHDADMELAS